MKKGTKIYLIIMGLILMISAGIGVVTRLSYKVNTDLEQYVSQAESYNVSLNEDEQYVSIYFDNQIKDLEELKEKSDVIIKVKPTTERIVYNQAILTEADVLEVYKAPDINEGNQIYIYEPNWFNLDTYTSVGGYNIMLPEQEYIFFLKKLKVPEGYEYKAKEAKSFMPVSTLYSKYPVKSEPITAIKRDPLINGQIGYDTVKEYELITTNSRSLELYQQFKKEVVQMRNNEEVD